MIYSNVIEDKTRSNEELMVFIASLGICIKIFIKYAVHVQRYKGDNLNMLPASSQFNSHVLFTGN